MFNLAKKIFGSTSSRTIKEFDNVIKKINLLENDISSLNDNDLSNKTIEFKNRLKNGESLEGVLPEAFAVVRESSKRTLNMRHFDVQLM